MNKPIFRLSPLLWLQVAVFTLFSARAWQHFFGDVPYRALFWDENLMSSLVKRFGYNWSDFVTDPAVENGMSLFIRSVGVLLTFGAMAALPLPLAPRLRRILLIIGAAVMLLLVVASWRDQFWQIGQLLELTLQWATPIFLVQWLYKKENPAVQSWLLPKIAVAATFIGHGLYAVGYYPTPGFFTTMTMRVFVCTEAQAKFFLLIAGTLDFIAAVLIFGPRRAAYWSYVYMAVWGGLTALARVTANLYWPFWVNWLGQWWPEMVFRLPHSLIPLFLLSLMRGQKDNRLGKYSLEVDRVP